MPIADSNPALTFIGEVQLTFLPTGGVAPADNIVAKFKSASLDVQASSTPHYGTYNGIKRKDRNPTTQIEASIVLTTDEVLDPELLNILMGGNADSLTPTNLEGSATVELYDLSDPTTPKKTFTAWKASLRPESGGDFGGENYTEISFRLDLLGGTGDLGTID